jgi:hypothetical protein
VAGLLAQADESGLYPRSRVSIIRRPGRFSVRRSRRSSSARLFFSASGPPLRSHFACTAPVLVFTVSCFLFAVTSVVRPGVPPPSVRTLASISCALSDRPWMVDSLLAASFYRAGFGVSCWFEIPVSPVLLPLRVTRTPC